MTKNDLVTYVTEVVGYPRKESVEIVEELLEGIKTSLIGNGQVKISGFGVFEVNHKQCRIGRNPKTKEEIEIPERNVLKFRTSQVLRKQLNGR